MDEMLKLTACARVMGELMAEGVDVALPVGACDIDMFAFVESRTAPCGLVSVPIQIVALHEDELLRNFENTRGSLGLLIALVWDVHESAPIRSFAFTSAELVLVKMIDLMCGADARRACAGTNSAAAREAVLQNAIEPFAISPGNWRKKLMAMVAGSSETQSVQSLEQ
jgi:hypothetical protein